MANEVFKIKENGEREYCASYDGDFSAFYTIQLWWCYMHKCNFYDRRNLDQAKRVITTSAHSAFFEENGDKYICTTPNKRSDEGVNKSKLEF